MRCHRLMLCYMIYNMKENLWRWQSHCVLGYVARSCSDRNGTHRPNQVCNSKPHFVAKLAVFYVFVTNGFRSIRTHGIFRLTTPGGMSVIRHCERRGFHSHEQPADGGPIYKHCTDVYMNPNLKFDVIDLRWFLLNTMIFPPFCGLPTALCCNLAL